MKLIELFKTQRREHFEFAPTVDFEMPRVCVACGEASTTEIAYSQDSVPVILGALAVWQVRTVTIPYCDACKRNFESRFTNLGYFQAATFLPGLALMFIGAQFDGKKGAYNENMALACVLGMLLLIGLSGSSFLIKSNLYDIWVSGDKSRLKISARSPKFIAALRELVSDSGN